MKRNRMRYWCLMLTVVISGTPFAQECVRITSIVRTTDNVRFDVIDIKSDAIVTDIVGTVHYQSNDTAKPKLVNVGDVLNHHTYLYLDIHSSIKGVCGKIKCIDLGVTKEANQYILHPTQCY